MDEITHVVPNIHSRRKGPMRGGLKELQPTNLLFRSLLSYRTYRLGDLSDPRTPRGNSKIKDRITRLELPMRCHTFDGRDPIHVLDFLARFVREADMLKMSEAQACIAVPYFLRGHAEQQLNAVRGSSSVREGGVTCWSEAVQYRQRSYGTSSAIRDAIPDLRDTSQHPDETETGFSTRLKPAFYRRGKVHTSEEKAKMFVDGLDTVIKTLVEQRREETHRMNYLELI